MTNKKAYNKIDNLCCLNANRYQKDFFKDYDGTDEDFCKDTNEMVDCLETIKQNLDKLESIKSIVDDYEKYKLKSYKPADDYIRQIKEVFGND